MCLVTEGLGTLSQNKQHIDFILTKPPGYFHYILRLKVAAIYFDHLVEIVHLLSGGRNTVVGSAL